MRTILLACMATLVIAVAAAAILQSSQQLAYEAYSTTGARVSEPGHNLVGKNWTGET